jgi:hypothetical protein
MSKELLTLEECVASEKSLDVDTYWRCRSWQR